MQATTLEGWPDALLVASGPALETTAAFAAGLVTAQSRGSQLVGRVVADAVRDRRAQGSVGRVADLCAAPGGKAAYVAALVPGVMVTAYDIDAGRCVAMTTNLARLGVAGADVVEADATALPASAAWSFADVLLDAPCSGLGVLAARPGLRWRRSEAVMRLHHEKEVRLAAAAARLVAPGGTLTYAVCSLEPDETHSVLAEADALRGWETDDLGAVFPAFAHPDDPRHLLVVPGRDGSSGFFVARLRRPRA